MPLVCFSHSPKPLPRDCAGRNPSVRCPANCPSLWGREEEHEEVLHPSHPRREALQGLGGSEENV